MVAVLAHGAAVRGNSAPVLAQGALVGSISPLILIDGFVHQRRLKALMLGPNPRVSERIGRKVYRLQSARDFRINHQATQILIRDSSRPREVVMATPGHSHSSGLPKPEKKIGPFPESAVKVGVLKTKIVSSRARVVCLPPYFILQ